MKTTHKTGGRNDYANPKQFQNTPKCTDITDKFNSTGAHPELPDPFKISSSDYQDVSVIGLFTKIEEGELKFLIIDEVQYYPGGASETVTKLPGAKIENGKNWIDAFRERMYEKIEIKPEKCKIGYIGSFSNTRKESTKAIVKIFVAIRDFEGELISSGKGDIKRAYWKTYSEVKPFLAKSQEKNFDCYLDGVTKLHWEFAQLAHELQTKIRDDRSAEELSKQHQEQKKVA